MNVAADIVVPACAWSAWNLIVAVGTSQMPTGWFRRHCEVTPRTLRIRRRERRLGPLHVRRWKRHLPDAGAVLPGLTPMRRLARVDAHCAERDATEGRRGVLERYSTDARRSEAVHWLSLVFVLPCFALWPFVVIGPMLVMALLINVPCLIALRDTRARIERLLVNMGERRSPMRATETGETDPLRVGLSKRRSSTSTGAHRTVDTQQRLDDARSRRGSGPQEER